MAANLSIPSIIIELMPGVVVDIKPKYYMDGQTMRVHCDINLETPFDDEPVKMMLNMKATTLDSIRDAARARGTIPQLVMLFQSQFTNFRPRMGRSL